MAGCHGVSLQPLLQAPGPPDENLSLKTEMTFIISKDLEK